MYLLILEIQCYFHQFQDIDNKAFNKGFFFFFSHFFFFWYKILHASCFLDMHFCDVPTFSTLYQV